MRLLRLDVETGKKLSQTVLDDRDPETGKNLQVKVKGLNMPVALPDVLSCDGRSVYMRSQRFDLAGRRREVVTPADAADQGGEGAHLFGTTGFLDGSWFHRGYWVYGKTPLSGAGGYYRAGHYAPAGRILAFDDSSVYGYGRKPQYFRWTTPLDYHLFATSQPAAAPAVPAAKAPARGSGGSLVSVPKSPSLNPANKPLTVEAWVKAAKPGGVVVARGAGSHGYALFVKRGRPQFAIRVSQQLHFVGAKMRVVGKWTHLAGVLTADKKLLLYVNGKLSASGEASGLIAADPKQAMEIAADERGNVGEYRSPFAFAGVIDEVKVYHRALSAAEIEKHWKQPAAPAADEAALVLYYSFDNGDAKDGSGNKNDGTVSAAAVEKGKLGNALRFTGRGAAQSRFTLKYHWSQQTPLHVRAMVLAGKTLFLAGPPDVVDEEQAFDHFADAAMQAKLAEQREALEGRKGALLWAVSAADGSKLAEYKLEMPPVWDGMAAANGRLYLATTGGKVLCFSRP